jgi:arabinogalactan oligomer/maltooligosaccharide transport system substrate-binding protein
MAYRARSRRLRTARLALAALTATAVLGGCGGSAGDGTGPRDARRNLLIWVGAGSGGEATKVLATEFGKEIGVDVTVELLPGDELQANFVTASQAGEAPDVVLGAHDWIGNLVQNGTIDPIQLTPEQRSRLQPLALQAVTFGGQLYGMPYTMNNVVLFRNTALAPEAPATLEELVDEGKKLKAAGKASELMALPVGETGNPYHINALYTSAGGYMFGTLPNGDFNPDDLGVARPEAAAAYTKIRSLGEKGEGALKRSITNENVLSIFTSGKTAFLVDGPWQMPLLDKSGVKYDVSPVPPFAGGAKASPFITVDAAYVASRGASKVLAQEFVASYWSRPEVALAYYRAAQGVPASTAVLDQIKGSDLLIAKVAAAGAAAGQIMPSIPQMAAVWDPLGKAEAAVIGGADPTPTIGAAATAIESQIS